MFSQSNVYENRVVVYDISLNFDDRSIRHMSILRDETSLRTVFVIFRRDSQK